MKHAKYAITIPRAMAAMLTGAAVGTLVFLLELAIFVALEPYKFGEIASVAGTSNTQLILMFFGYVSAFFVGGVLIVGAPIWRLLHYFGRRNWFDSLCLGAVLSAAGFVLLSLLNPNWQGLSLISFLTEDFGGITAINDRLTEDGWSALFRGSIGIAVAGAAAGFAIWKVAYGAPSRGEETAV